MLVESELIKQKFAYLNPLPKINTWAIEDEDGTVCKTHTFINGSDVPENYYEAEYPKFKTIEEAVEATDNAIKNVITNYKKVWLRIFPMLKQLDDGTYLIRTRLAYK
ncbi:MAG: hypothetical protein N3I35_06690 [Clostridia bacterium]|nr:hypothetical protein [Clostridia bacterium]